MEPCITRNKKGHVEIEGKNVILLAREFGTPLFILCGKHLRESYRNFRDEFLRFYPKIIVAYSYKANYLPYVCNVIKDEGGWAEVVSSLELNIAKSIGQDPQKIIFNGPAKTYEELLEAIKYGIGIINVDSLSELRKIILISEKLNLSANIGIRLNIASRAGYDKFGMEVDQVKNACKMILSSKNLNYVGLHAHLGTQILEITSYESLVKLMKSVAKMIKEKYKLETRFVDIGGGFPVKDLPTVGLQSYKIPEMRQIAEIIGAVAMAEFSKLGPELPYLVLEPGRVIVSSAMILLIKVIATKTLRDTRIVITDGGLNLLPEAEYYEYEIIPAAIAGKKTYNVQIAGPLCMKEDIIGRKRKLPHIREGDILVVLNAGGYSVSLSWQFIKTRPPIILVDDQKNIKIIRKKESVNDLLKLDSCCRKFRNS